ncbi:MAG: hypothetical protein A2020_08160 [Lentisphaerae bacterium GWF2_45_14]|nr:MAG: hypothetical protein A2020_08160 [Lentisphaerae bacterium GWF2_45_14]
MNLVWSIKTTPTELHPILETLAEEYPLTEGTQGINLSFEKISDQDCLRVIKNNDGFQVFYGRKTSAARGVAYALSTQECNEKISFKTYGILLDCSRTAVVTPQYFKRWLRRLALMGYNMAMLYTKDAYQLPDENYFGYMRGAYSIDEIREIDAYAQKLGIEMVASIQVLGHLEPIMRWGSYYEVKDTNNVILVDYEKSYVLLEKMLKFWSDALSSRRIHLGMDETHDLGRGKFMDNNGYEDPYAIYNRHLKRMSSVCEKYQLKPMIWNDMYFRYGNKDQNYYDSESPIPEEVKKSIPQSVQLCYWDYYHRDQETYSKMLNRSKMLNNKSPIMASGVWTWKRMWCDFELTKNTVKPCVDACREQNVDELIFTLWGDDGAYCEFESAFAGLAWAADYAYNEKSDDKRLSNLYQAIFGTSYELQVELGDMEFTYSVDHPKSGRHEFFKVSAAALLWDDPLMGIVWHEYSYVDSQIWQKSLTNYKRLLAKAGECRNDRHAGIINHAYNILDTLIQKIELRMALQKAYKDRDTVKLSHIQKKSIPEVMDAVDKLNDSFRDMWFRGYKSYGLEIMQIKLAGLRERYCELGRRLDEFLNGKIPSIHELEIEPDVQGFYYTDYHHLATGGWFI